MVIDSLNLNLRQILPIYPRLLGNVPLSPREAGKHRIGMMDPLQMENETARLAAWWR